ncbi:MAG: hypothetical protein FJZ47_03105 [Candidatus Tectomicrobia bacterium]|uniref:Uncharacterized protein n=1 Tax=Tectimicrobiota bacterium TaxID=2528274 RepID=A0A938B1D3_UNCTE|nr:hypothetical protein [Candidatus Tectomicrobia bacterium]
MQRKGFILALLVLTFAVTSSAYAVCDQQRLKVVRSEGPTVAGGGIFIYDFAPPTVLPTFYYRFTTSDPEIMNLLNAALVGTRTVRVQGNATTCPTSGTIRNGGVIIRIFVDTYF